MDICAISVPCNLTLLSELDTSTLMESHGKVDLLIFSVIIILFRLKALATVYNSTLYMYHYTCSIIVLRVLGKYHIYLNKRPTLNKHPPQISAHPKGRKS